MFKMEKEKKKREDFIVVRLEAMSLWTWSLRREGDSGRRWPSGSPLFHWMSASDARLQVQSGWVDSAAEV